MATLVFSALLLWAFVNYVRSCFRYADDLEARHRKRMAEGQKIIDEMTRNPP